MACGTTYDVLDNSTCFDGYYVSGVSSGSFFTKGNSYDDESSCGTVHCECLTFYSGCRCDKHWFDETGPWSTFWSHFYEDLYAVQTAIFALIYLTAAYYALLQLGHTDEFLIRLGHAGCQAHTDHPIRTSFARALQLFLARICKWCTRKGTEIQGFIGNQQLKMHTSTPAAMALKGNVLQNAFLFCFLFGIWCLNPYDVFFCTNNFWWAWFYFGLPFMVYSYESILFKWYRLNSMVSKRQLTSVTSSEKTVSTRLLRLMPKVAIFIASIFATVMEIRMDRCVRRTQNADDECEHFLVWYTTRTTWAFFAWGMMIMLGIIVYFFLFCSYGRHLRSVLNRPERQGLSAEAKNINKFLYQLSGCFTICAFTFVFYCIWPYSEPASHMCFWLVWKILLTMMLFCVFRCLRMPKTTRAQWMATCICCGESSQRAVEDKLTTVGERGHEMIRNSTIRSIVPKRRSANGPAAEESRMSAVSEHEEGDEEAPPNTM